VYAYGDAKSYGSMLGTQCAHDRDRYHTRRRATAEAKMGIFTFGDARFFVTCDGLNKPSSLRCFPGGNGMAGSSDGGIFSFDARSTIDRLAAPQ